MISASRSTRGRGCQSRRLPENPLGSLLTVDHSRGVGILPTILLKGLSDSLHLPMADLVDTDEVRLFDANPVLTLDARRRPSADLILGVIITRSNKSSVVYSLLTLPQTNGSLYFEGFNEHMTKLVAFTAPSLL